MKRGIVVWVLFLSAISLFLFKGEDSNFDRALRFIRHESIYMIHCKALLPRMLKTPATLDIVHKFEAAEPSDGQNPARQRVVLTYDAQNLQGALVRNEFECVYEAGATIGPKNQPKILAGIFDSIPLPDEKIEWLNRVSELGLVLGD